jgi:hypothetical protein
MRNVTLKNLVNDLELICTNHKELNSFGFGDITQITVDTKTKEEPLYPRMYVIPSNLNLNQNENSYSINIVLMDRLLSDYSNQLDVTSDMMEISKDIFTTLYQSYQVNSGLFSTEYEVTFGASVTPFLERFETVLAGCTLTINISVAHDYNRCVLPINNIP